MSGRWQKILVVVTMMAVSGCSALTGARGTGSPDEAQLEVDRAKVTLESFLAAEEGTDLRLLLGKAKGVMIVPQLLRAGFIWGGSGGSGVLLARDPDSGAWNGPAFYGMGDVSWGLQAGGEAAEVILLVMTKKGFESLLTTNVKVGADLSVAVISAGAGAGTNLNADVLALSRSKGLFGGLTLKGSVIRPREAWNRDYYGEAATATDLLVRESATNAGANSLKAALASAAG